MAVRFIVGRAGSGKTYACLQAIRARSRENPIDGPRLILLVPEQAGLQMERAILVPSESSASESDTQTAHRAEVFSFQRLARRVLDFVGGPQRMALSEPARAMVLRHLLADHADQFQYYRRAAKSGSSGGRFGGLANGIGAILSEFIQEGIEPADLSLYDQPTGSQTVADDPIHRTKLHDLRLIYDAYLRYLGTQCVDPSQFLQLARDCFSQCNWLSGAEVWVDGFASLSGQETLTLIALARQCRTVAITVMMDPRLCVDDTHPVDADTRRLFDRTSRTYRDLGAQLAKAGIEVDEPELLHAERNHRFTGAKELERLERSLFSLNNAPRQRIAGPTRIELVDLPSRRVEVDFAVSRVRRWVQESNGKRRYRDIAIIVRDLDPYHDLLSAALAVRDIPFFIDRRCPVTHHPIVELLRAMTAMGSEDMSVAAVRLALKTGLLPLTTGQADELENYVLAHGIHGTAKWRKPWTFHPRSSFLADLDEKPTGEDERLVGRVNEARCQLIESLDPWLTCTADAVGHAGAVWAAAILDSLECMAVSPTLKAWTKAAEDQGDLNQADQHRQVWRDMMSFVDDLAFALGDIRMTITELSDVLSSGLSEFTLGLVPPTVDQVLVGSIERSRHPEIKAAIILGFNDGVFPKKHSEDCILNDADRATLQDAGLDLRPPTRQRILDEAMLVYVACTRPSERLIITYSTSDNEGKALRPSPYIHAIRSACPGLEVESIADPLRARATWDVLTHRDLAARLTLEFRTRPAPSADDPTLRNVWNTLYEQTRGAMQTDAAARFGLSSLDDDCAVRLSPNMIEQLYRGPLTMSISRLETFASCPFKYFASHVLNLRERAEATLAPPDIGSFQHGILEEFTRELVERDAGFQDLSESELQKLLEFSHDRMTKRLPVGGAVSDARNQFVLRRSAANLFRMIKAQQRRSSGGSWRPRAAELTFGMNEAGGLPALTINTPAGRRLLLRGIIDRVDLVEFSGELLGVVIDYKKRANQRLDLSHAYHGLSLQLLTYNLVLSEAGEALTGRAITPIASLYVSLAAQYQSVDHPNEQKDRNTALEGTYRPRGLIRADRFDALDPNLESNWSPHYSFYRKNDGTMGQMDKTDGAEAAAYDGMLRYTRMRLGEFADSILDGRVTPSPYRLGTESPCRWCPMTSVCRFEPGIGKTRRLPTYARSEILARVTQDANGGETS